MIKIIPLIFILVLIIGCQQKVEKTFNKFDWDDDGMLVIDGQRIFIIGSYHLPRTADPYRTLT